MSSNTLDHVELKRLVLDRIPLFVIDGGSSALG
jgi:hypothetical protein